ncbi:hypothetical protein B0H13DRAFT_1873594 [Mycena leptocephala]|nr:hypothetical protein B0H13DRAFT_1873594 [Mycena leptocephala]
MSDWATETLKIKTSSNFINHADECPKRPPAQSWEQYEIARERKRKNLPEFPINSDPSLFEVEQDMMQGFIQRGIDNPAKTVTNLSYHCAPLDGLHKALGNKLKEDQDKELIKISSNEDWVLHEYVVDLIPLDGDHSGKAVGRLVFKHLKKYKAAGDVWEMLSSLLCFWKATTMHPAMDRSTIQLRRERSWALSDSDMYENRKFPLVYDPAADPVVIAEMELMADEATKLESRKNTAPDSETDSTKYNSEGDPPTRGSVFHPNGYGLPKIMQMHRLYNVRTRAEIPYVVNEKTVAEKGNRGGSTATEFTGSVTRVYMSIGIQGTWRREGGRAGDVGVRWMSTHQNEKPRTALEIPAHVEPHSGLPSAFATYTARARRAGSGCTAHSSILRKPSLSFLSLPAPGPRPLLPVLRAHPCRTRAHRALVMHAMEGAAARNMTSRRAASGGARRGSLYRPQPTDARAHRARADGAEQISHRTQASRIVRSGNAHDGAGGGQRHLKAETRSQGASHLAQLRRPFWQRTRRRAQ